MSKISLTPNASGTGNFTIASPNGNTDRTLTLPDNTGTILTTASTFGGTGPAFSAYANSATSLSNGAFTKISFQVEEYDTNSNFSSSRFTPTVAGYYQVNAAASVSGGTTAELSIAVYKNGSNHKQGPDFITAGSQYSQSMSTLVYCNGSSDYIEIYVYIATTSKSTGTGEVSVWFNGAMVRSA